MYVYVELRIYLLRKRRFEEKLTLTSLYKKFIYLSFKIENIKISILIDIRPTNLFMNPIYTKKLKLTQEPIKKVKVSFAWGRETTNLVVKDLKFKYKNIRFQKDFIIYNLNKIDVILENIFYEIKI